MKNVIFIAPPAAGKGTQSAKLVEIGYTHISTGNMLREEMAAESKIGLEIKEIMKNGFLVNDEIVYKLVSNKLSKIDGPFILDGYPRTIVQAILLDKLFQSMSISQYEVIYLDIELEEALKRTLGRLTCECGASYSTFFEELKPKVANICDKCNRKLVQRTDDNEESFKSRFKTFLKNNQPIMDFYKSKNKLHVINTGIGNLKVFEKIKEILK